MSDETWIRIERDFDAPIETVWAMWTDAQLFASWYGPMGFTIPSAQMDTAIGGTRKICMEMSGSEQAMRMWFTGVYKELSPPHRLVYTESMCDEDGTIIPAKALGLPDDHPDVTEVTVDLSETDGKTRMVMVHRGVPAGSPGEGGWNQAFDKLSGELAAG